MELTRKAGIELEGYLGDYPGDIELVGARIGKDGSLSNDDWDYHDEPFGVEVRTEPLTNLKVLDGIWRDLDRHDWTVDECAGTHVHIDISDFSTSEKVKLLRFGKGIERIIFLFVEDYRYNNSYCEPIHTHWRGVFKSDSRYNDIDWDSLKTNQVNDHLSMNYRRRRHGSLWNGKYQWMNVFGGRYPTVEYRLYHAAEDLSELKGQVRMSMAIVDLVKNSTLEQLEFILKELYKQPNVETLVTKFFEVLSLDFELDVRGKKAYNYLETKLSNKGKKELAV
jgi:hypothetical protein